MEIIRKVLKVVFFPFYLRKDVMIIKQLLISKIIMDIGYKYDISNEAKRPLFDDIICISKGDFSHLSLERKR
jgi:hypothetical protein